MKRLIICLLVLFAFGCASTQAPIKANPELDGNWVGQSEGLFGIADINFRIKDGIISGEVVKSPVVSQLNGYVDESGNPVLKPIRFYKSIVSFHVVHATETKLKGTWSQKSISATGTWFAKKKIAQQVKY